MGKSQSNLLALLAGIAVGALAGVLLAPEKGEQTREKIAKKSADLKKELEEQVELNKDKLAKIAESVVQPLKEALKNGTAVAEKPNVADNN
jgi:gas vesicle protein